MTITCQALLGMVKKIMDKTQFLLSRVLCTNGWDTSYKYITYNKLTAKGGVRTECKEKRWGVINSSLGTKDSKGGGSQAEILKERCLFWKHGIKIIPSRIKIYEKRLKYGTEWFVLYKNKCF